MKTTWRIAYYLFVFGITSMLVLYSALGIWFEIDGWAPFLTTCFTIGLVVQGIHDIKDEPLEYALLTWFGMRTPIGFREGIKFIPLFLGFGFERIEIKNKNIKVVVKVSTLEKAQIPITIELDARPDLNHLREFVDNNGYKGMDELLADPVRTAVNYQCNGISMYVLAAQGPTFAKRIRRQLTGLIGEEGSNDDFGGTGSMIPETGKLSFEAKLPQAVTDAIDRAVAVQKDIEGYDQLTDSVETLTDKKIARGDTRPRDVIQREIMLGLAVQQGKARQINFNDNGGGGKKGKRGRNNLFFDADEKT